MSVMRFTFTLGSRCLPSGLAVYTVTSYLIGDLHVNYLDKGAVPASRVCHVRLPSATSAREGNDDGSCPSTAPTPVESVSAGVSPREATVDGSLLAGSERLGREPHALLSRRFAKRCQGPWSMQTCRDFWRGRRARGGGSLLWAPRSSSNRRPAPMA